jgi:Spy/CpxP family protein refolding chaperone
MMVKRKKTVIAAICMAASVGFVAEVNASAPPPRDTRDFCA